MEQKFEKIPFICLENPGRSFIYTLIDESKCLYKIQDELYPLKIEKSLLKNMELDITKKILYYKDFLPFYFSYDERKLDIKNKIFLKISHIKQENRFTKKETFFIKANIHDSILDLKIKIEKKNKKIIIKNNLLFKKETYQKESFLTLKNILENNKTLKDYAIKNKHELVLINKFLLKDYKRKKLCNILLKSKTGGYTNFPRKKFLDISKANIINLKSEKYMKLSKFNEYIQKSKINELMVNLN